MKQLLHLLVLFFVFGLTAQEIEHKHSQYYALTENKGQWPDDVLFQSRSQGQNIWIQQHGFLFDLRDYSSLRRAHDNPGKYTADPTYKGHLFSAAFLGSNKVSSIQKENPTSYYYNYFIGKDSARWSSDVRGYEEITLKDFYDNIDLKVFDHDTKFKYELWCYPGSNPTSIKIAYGAKNGLRIDKKGNLVIKTALGEIAEQKPIAYELFNGNLKEISCKFELNEGIVNFKTAKIRAGAILIIDPVLVFATYSGSPSDNFGMTATYGYDGTAYSGGTVYGNSYPTPQAPVFNDQTTFDEVYDGLTTTDVFISKYNPLGTEMIWTNFLSGGNENQGTETVHSLICDKQNNIYAYGATSSSVFPIKANAFKDTMSGGTNFNVANNGANFGTNGTDIYVSKISADGRFLLGSTYVGGTQNDGVNYLVTAGSYNSADDYDSLTTNYGDQFRGEIMLDQDGNCIVASSTRSRNFAPGKQIDSLRGQQDCIVFKLNSDLTQMAWARYYGGKNNDAGYSVKIDSSYNIVFAGGTCSDTITGTANGWKSTYQGGKTDGYVAKLTPDGQTIMQATYIGDTLYDQVMFVEINRNDEVFVYGQTSGGNYPIINAVALDTGGGQFITKLNPQLTNALNSFTFGSGDNQFDISPCAFLVDICGNMYVSGWGGNILNGSNPLIGMPISPDAFLNTPPNNFDFYLGVFSKDFDGLLYGTYMGGNQAAEHVDGGTSRFDKNGVVYQSVCGGCTGKSDFPTTLNAWSNLNLNAGPGSGNNNCNNVVFKFDFQLIPRAEFTTDDLTGCEDFTVELHNTSTPSDSYLWDFGNGDTSTVIFNPTVTYTEPGTYVVTLHVTDSICLLTDSTEITINVYPELQLTADDDKLLCFAEEVTLTADGLGSAGTIIWSSNSNFTDTLNTLPDSVITVFPETTTTYYVKIENPGCSKIDSVTLTILNGDLSITGNDSLCLGETSLLTANVSTTNETYTYAWSPSDILAPTGDPNSVVAAPTESVWVYCTVTSSNGCITTDSVYLNLGSLPVNISASVSPDSVVPGQTVTLTANPPGYSYSWTPQEGLSDPFARVTQAVVNEPTVYIVNINDNGCVRSTSVKVYIIPVICGGRFIYIPNAFSPNGDGQNDKMFVYSAVADQIEFRVFDRWGEMIFESYSINDGWDGTFRGKLVDPDVYDYYLKAVCFDGTENIIKGNITLIR